MSESFLKNPLSLFDIRGKTAIITGASGAFGALAAKTFAGAGANLILAASKAEELKTKWKAWNKEQRAPLWGVGKKGEALKDE